MKKPNKTIKSFTDYVNKNTAAISKIKMNFFRKRIKVLKDNTGFDLTKQLN